jgi:cytochrome c556
MTLTGVLSGASLLVKAQNLAPDEVIKNRIANFRKIGKAFKGIRDQVKAKDPNVALIQDLAGQIETLGSQIPTWFPPGTADGKTNAKPAVWTERVTFEQAHMKFHTEAQKLNQLAQSGNSGEIAAQYKVLGGTCKNCHDTFRGKVDNDD